MFCSKGGALGHGKGEQILQNRQDSRLKNNYLQLKTHRSGGAGQRGEPTPSNGTTQRFDAIKANTDLHLQKFSARMLGFL